MCEIQGFPKSEIRLHGAYNYVQQFLNIAPWERVYILYFNRYDLFVKLDYKLFYMITCFLNIQVHVIYINGVVLITLLHNILILLYNLYKWYRTYEFDILFEEVVGSWWDWLTIKLAF